MTGRTASCSGVALLLVLVALSVALAGLAAALGLSQATRHAQHARGVDDQLVALALATEGLARRWIADAGATMVLDPDQPRAGVLVLDDRITVPAHGDALVRVEVYDAWAGLPGHLVGPAGALATFKPARWGGVAIPASVAGGPAGASDLIERVRGIGALPRFPDPRDPARTGLALAHWLAPHSDGRVNVNTVPPSLLQGLIERAGRGDARAILERRRRGERVTLQHRRIDARDEHGFQLVDRTACWNARIDVRWAGHHRAWWVVFAATEAGLFRVQRHVIHD
ncbi:MAG: type II secretion system protein GspK [Rhodosalinus sp.]